MSMIRVAPVIGAVWLLVSSVAAETQQSFRTRTDLILVDLQVIDKTGQPVANLTPGAFEVTVGGKSRRVVAAEFIRNERMPLASSSGAVSTPARSPLSPTAPVAGPRDDMEAAPFYLVIDKFSFAPVEALLFARVAQQFVQRLATTERVGLFAFPQGPMLEATTDRASIVAALDQVTGLKVTPPGFPEFPMPQDIVDARAGELYRLALSLEAQNFASFGMLRDFFQRLGKVPGRKNVVYLSAGAVVADRPGLRPDNGEIGIQVGQAAAAARATVYTLFPDETMLHSFSAERSGSPKYGSGRLAIRDAEILERAPAQFAGASGGSFFKIMTGGGEQAYERILTETSAYYVIGVEPEDRDRDGRAHELRVRVSTPSARVQAPTWVRLAKE